MMGTLISPFMIEVEEEFPWMQTYVCRIRKSLLSGLFYHLNQSWQACEEGLMRWVEYGRADMRKIGDRGCDQLKTYNMSFFRRIIVINIPPIYLMSFK